MNPRHAQARNYLGYSWAERGINLDKALEHIQKALEIDPENGAYIDSLGWVYFQQGEYVRAREELKKAIKLMKDSVIYEHLGDTYNKLGETRRALDAYRKALQLDKENEKLMEKIRNAKKQLKK